MKLRPPPRPAARPRRPRACQVHRRPSNCSSAWRRRRPPGWSPRPRPGTRDPSSTTSATASATDEVGTSTMTSTSWTSIHSLAHVRADVRLVLGGRRRAPRSARSSTLPPKSSTAIRAASTEPWPGRSIQPDRPSITPTRPRWPEISVRAVPVQHGDGAHAGAQNLGPHDDTLTGRAESTYTPRHREASPASSSCSFSIRSTTRPCSIRYAGQPRSRRRSSLLDQQHGEPRSFSWPDRRSAARSRRQNPRPARPGARATRRSAGCARSPASAARRPTASALRASRRRRWRLLQIPSIAMPPTRTTGGSSRRLNVEARKYPRSSGQ